MKLKKWVKQYLEIVAARGLATSTAAEKTRYAKLLCQAIGKKKRLRKVMPIDIARVVGKVWQSGQQAKAQRILSVARDLFSEAIWHGELTSNPATHLKPRAYRVRRARLSLSQWLKTQTIMESEKTQWRRCLMLLALVTAQRRSDLIRMRFDDVWRGHLHIEQKKTGMRIALPLNLRLKAINMTLADVIDKCRAYAPAGEYMLRSRKGLPVSAASASLSFRRSFRRAIVWERVDRNAPSLAEIRSLSARLYRDQGINSQILLGHRKAATTAIYHNDRGLSRDEQSWMRLKLPRARPARDIFPGV
jgi:integrase